MMNVVIQTYYKEHRSNFIKDINRVLASARIAVLCFIMLTFVHVYGIEPEALDTLVVSSRVQSNVDFKVNLYDVDRGYHGNDAKIEDILVKMDSMAGNPWMRVNRITVVGAASPEGPYGNNVRLAENRAKALLSILRERYSFPDSIYSVSIVPEDWEGMRIILEKDSTIPYAGDVVGFLESSVTYGPDMRERLLRRLKDGRPFSSMSRNVLPFLRRASVYVDYDCQRVDIAEMPGVVPVSIPSSRILNHGLETAAYTQPLRSAYGLGERFFAIKTNLLWDAALCANLGFELELWPHWSIDVPVWYSPYDITKRWRLRLLAIQPELRYWLRGAGRGHYFGLHASVAGFNVSFGGDYRYQDPNHAAFGLGVGYGYAFHLDKSRKWSLEAQIGAGYLSYKWVKFRNTGRNGAMVARGSGIYWGVTRVGFALSYKFYKERKGRRWMKW